MITAPLRGCPSPTPVRGWLHLGSQCWFPRSQAALYQQVLPSSPSWWTLPHIVLVTGLALAVLAGIATWFRSLASPVVGLALRLMTAANSLSAVMNLPPEHRNLADGGSRQIAVGIAGATVGLLALTARRRVLARTAEGAGRAW